MAAASHQSSCSQECGQEAKLHLTLLLEGTANKYFRFITMHTFTIRFYNAVKLQVYPNLLGPRNVWILTEYQRKKCIVDYQ